MSSAISALGGKASTFDAIAGKNDVTRLNAKASTADKSELRTAFDSFVGEVFFGQMMESMRKTVGKPAYMHGGRGEEVFTKQLDQMFSEQMSKASASQFTGPMFDLFSLNRS
ncbi:MAG: rod-binding protein [Planctomycetia bacterium]|nr:rod-binding protein [Planctomycetia bacterium]